MGTVPISSQEPADSAAQILAKVGGPHNILSLTHCATRLRFELKDAGQVDAAALDKVPGVIGTMPQSGDRYQVVIGGAVQTTYNQLIDLLQMSGAFADLAVEATGAEADVQVASAIPTAVLGAPMAGRMIPLAEVEDKVFASKALGEGVGIVPTDGRVVAPVSGVLLTVAKSGHAFGIRTDDGVEVLVHVGIGTVRLEGRGFHVLVAKGQRVTAGDILADVDLDSIRAAGYDSTTVLVVVNTLSLSSVSPRAAAEVGAGDPVIDLAI